MTAYTTISNALVAVGAKPFATTVQAFRDNPIAIAEGDVTAPVNSPGWHPYNMVNANDGATGRIYDFAIDGSVATVSTPTMVDGYDYMVRWSLVSPSVISAFRIAGVSVTPNLFAASDTLTGYLVIEMPTLENYPKTAFINTRVSSGLSGIATVSGSATTPFIGYFNFSNMATALTSIDLSWSSGSFDAGQVFFYRRRNYISG